jgi:hypothetical protein
MAEMTHDEMIGGLLHDIARAQCHLEDADRDLSVVAADLAKLMEALEPSTAHLLGPFARGLQNHLNGLEQFDEAIHVTLMPLTDRLESLTSGRAAPERRGDGYSPKKRGGIDGYSLTDSLR